MKIININSSLLVLLANVCFHVTVGFRAGRLEHVILLYGFTACHGFFEIYCAIYYVVYSPPESKYYFSAADWKFGANQFVKALPDKVVVHCKSSTLMLVDVYN